MDQPRGGHHDEEMTGADTSMISGTSPYQPTTEPVPNRRQVIGGLIVNILFIKSVAGVLKVVEIVFCLIIAICLGTITSCNWSCGAISFMQIVSISALIFTIIIYIVFAFNLDEKVSIINWPLTDLINIVIDLILFFIASCYLASKTVSGGGKAATAFGFFATLAFLGSCWFAYHIFRSHMQKKPTVSHVSRTETHTRT